MALLLKWMKSVFWLAANSSSRNSGDCWSGCTWRSCHPAEAGSGCGRCWVPQCQTCLCLPAHRWWCFHGTQRYTTPEGKGGLEYKTVIEFHCWCAHVRLHNRKGWFSVCVCVCMCVYVCVCVCVYICVCKITLSLHLFPVVKVRCAENLLTMLSCLNVKHSVGTLFWCTSLYLLLMFCFSFN